MSRQLQVLQAAAAVMLVAGCASSQTNIPSLKESQAATRIDITQSTAKQTTTGPLPLPQPRSASAPIAAGKSDPSVKRYLLPDGQLTPTLAAYASEVAKVRNIPQAQVQAILEHARYDAGVARLMTPSPTRIRRSWVTYRKRFVEPIRIKAGVEFWQQNKKVLDSTSAAYGVPPSIIAAIIGIETLYGRHTGNFRVLDALITLGFSHPDTARPERSQLFRDQLADLIQLDHEKKLDALQVQGSFAGAMGLPQFMPGSLLRYAVDGNNDDRIDLMHDVEDAVASVAAFLRHHGWVPGLPVFAPIVLPPAAAALVDGGLSPTLDWRTLAARGATVRPGARDLDWQHHALGIVDLLDEPRKLAEYRVGTPNFFAITHYNRSYFYATSVADLAQALSDRMAYGGPD